MAAEKRWVRICGGSCKDTKCTELSGRSYPQDQEAEAKKKAHPNCQCTARLVGACEGAMGAGDLSITADSDLSGRTVTVTAEVTNGGTADATNVVIDIEISAEGGDLHHKSYSLGTIPKGGSKTQTDSFTIGFTDIPRATRASGNNDITTIATVDYDMNGTHTRAQNACYAESD
jgi:hypothetical protein